MGEERRVPSLLPTTTTLSLCVVYIYIYMSLSQSVVEVQKSPSVLGAEDLGWRKRFTTQHNTNN